MQAETSNQAVNDEGECQALAESVVGGEAGEKEDGEQLERPNVPSRLGFCAVVQDASTESPVLVLVPLSVRSELRELGN